jgi:threonine dehydratase
VRPSAKIAASKARSGPPVRRPFVIEGQGTAGLEILEQADAPLDQLLCGTSGGGLIAGINLVMEALSHEPA